MAALSHGNTAGLVRELQRVDRESSWVEFKVNNSDPEEIGEYISALSNSAAHVDKSFAYLVWGIEDTSHEIVGTTFKPRAVRVGGEELESWLLRLLTPKIDFTFLECTLDDVAVVLLEIPRAAVVPVQFKGNEFIRVGSYKKRLKDHPQIERELWRVFDRTPFESLVACEGATDKQVRDMLDVNAYFDLLETGQPDDSQALVLLERDRMIQHSDSGGWDITNLGAVALARKIENFSRLARKAVRVVQYPDNTRTGGIGEQIGTKGYAVGFEGLISYVRARLPQLETIDSRRHVVEKFPTIALRELIANALIHQDFLISGAGPMVEVFADRVEITNPGQPLVNTERLLDNPPRSRNEALASFMRRAGICEERGSGVDKAVSATELAQLPAPEFRVSGDNMTSTIFAHRKLSEMDKADRLRAVYLHACLRFVNRSVVTNTTIRERFGIDSHNSARASRLIGEAVEARMILPRDASAGRKNMQYIPYWASNHDAI